MKLNELMKKSGLSKSPGLWIIYTLGLTIMVLQLRSIMG